MDLFKTSLVFGDLLTYFQFPKYVCRISLESIGGFSQSYLDKLVELTLALETDLIFRVSEIENKMGQGHIKLTMFIFCHTCVTQEDFLLSYSYIAMYQ